LQSVVLAIRAKCGEQTAFLPTVEVFARRQTPDLERLMRMTESEFQEWFAGTAVIRIGRDRLRRNAAVALGNSRDPQAIPVLKDAINDDSELVRSHSRWALDHLLSQLRTTTS